ncbi:LysM peptidoglycan-binding domain-containing protein [Flavivirga amylovorans]|uniref:LysM peptidoglycan-binding domain-containing protein n=1 Tax=Flavivirga amylovorans TaxID=870486 RepID=A0ABT8X4S5_9FLAO|nr:LysM peptidoglycan-binding domain-containing protein [Flavivirga amylovorans]MDO5988895.1 LysM peptidoglycan-binding domain-containing protein [Flavivirga amylovorans]
MSKNLMTITAYSDNEYSSKTGDSCTVQINPASYTHDHTIEYNKFQPVGSPGTSVWYKGTPPEKVTFDIYFDATGAVSTTSLLASQTPVSDQIDSFKSTCFTYNGSIHEPNYLMLSWGTLVFKCKLTALNISYTLFQSDGTPLRAKLSTTFEGAISADDIAAEADNQSPDLTHFIEVKEGDTLPLICYRIYGDSSYYTEVASYNNVLNFRNIAPGTKLYLPPLK